MELIRYFGFFIILLATNVVYCQFIEDFADGDLTNNPIWIGDIDDFSLNQNGELQLQALESGTSGLATSFQLTDNFQWDIDFRLDFSPSGSNRLRLYLLSESSEDLANTGYYLEIGETGSNDAIRLIDGFNDEVIAIGNASRVASNPEMLIRVNLTEEGNLIIASRAEGESIFSLELEMMIRADLNKEYFFGFECRYTSTRRDKFFFNSIVLGTAVEDVIPPQLVDVQISDSNEFCLVFNETIDEVLSQEELLIRVNGTTISDLNFVAQNVKFTDESTGPEDVIELFITGISDAGGNRLDTMLTIIRGVVPTAGDLLVNEILFDPVKEGEDFLELINVSDKTLDLEGLVIQNNNNNQKSAIGSQIILIPGEIAAMTENKVQLVQFYPQANENNIYTNNLPSFNNEDGNISLLSRDILIESFDYSDEQHSPLLDEPEGVSLERISTIVSATDMMNWASASELSGFATPGSVNSIRALETERELVSLTSESFSPNGDGDTDELEINLSPGMSSIGNVVIYDQVGNMVSQLLQNSLLGSVQILKWDGTLENGSVAPIGIYIIRIEVLDTAGNVFVTKKSVALLDFIR